MNNYYPNEEATLDELQNSLNELNSMTDEIMATTRIITLGTTIISIAMLLFIIFMIISMWKVFKKARKPGWASIIPVYNAVVLYQICGLNPLLLLLSLIPVVNVIAMIILSILQCTMLSKTFGKSIWFGIGLVFLNPIFMGILAFSDAEYLGN